MSDITENLGGLAFTIMTYCQGYSSKLEDMDQNFSGTHQHTTTSLNDMQAIQRLFPDAKDARFGLMYGFVRGTFIYFANESAAQFARTMCTKDTNK